MSPFVLGPAFLAELRGPDTTNTLRPLHQLLINDAPWILARIKSSHIHIAHRRLGANKGGALARALRLRLLSEAVVEEVDESLLDVGGARSSPAPPAGAGAAADQDGQHVIDDEIPLERLLSELAPYVAHTSPKPASTTPTLRKDIVEKRRQRKGRRGSALLFRLLWLLDRQLQNSAGRLGDGEEGGAERRESGQGSVGVWNAERFCQRLKRLPCSIVRVDKIASRFLLLQAEALAPCPLEDGGLPEAWRDAQARIDVTNPMRKLESVLVVDERHNVLVVTSALLQLLPLMLAKLADSINRTLGSVLTADSERVLSSLLGCESEEAMRHTLAQMHCGNQDTECDDAMQHSLGESNAPEGEAGPEGEASEADVEEKDGLGRCLVPLNAVCSAQEPGSDRRTFVGAKIGPAGVKQMSLISLRGIAQLQDQDPRDQGKPSEGGPADEVQKSQGGASDRNSRATRLRAGDIVGILQDSNTAGSSRARAGKTSKEGDGVGGSEAELIAVEVLKFYPNSGLAVISAVGNVTGEDGETTGEGWAERVVVVEKELWWKNGDTASGMEGIGSSRSDVRDDDASASEEEEDEDASASAGAARGNSQEEWEAPDSAAEGEEAEGEEDDDPGDLLLVCNTCSVMFSLTHSVACLVFVLCVLQLLANKGEQASVRCYLMLPQHVLTVASFPPPRLSHLRFHACIAISQTRR